MPWKTATMTTERARFVLEAERSFLSFSELCRRHGISRPTGRKWLKRYREAGLAGLVVRSHRPHSCSHLTPEPVVTRILEIRKRHGWGAPKIQRILREERDAAPSIDASHRVLLQHELVTPRKPRRRRTHPGAPTRSMDAPNATWTADFKGEWRCTAEPCTGLHRTGDGTLCYPLTVQDGYSRSLLECRGLARLDAQQTRRRFEHLFREYGLPERVRTGDRRTRRVQAFIREGEGVAAVRAVREASLSSIH